MLIVTRGSIKELGGRELLKRLDRHRYKVSLKKSKFFQKKAKWCGFKISEEGVTPRISRFEKIQKIQPPKILTEFRSFLGSVQYLMRYIPSLTAKPVTNC